MRKPKKDATFYGFELERVCWFVAILYTSKYTFKSLFMDYSLCDFNNRPTVEAYGEYIEIFNDFLASYGANSLIYKVHNDNLDDIPSNCPFAASRSLFKMRASDIVRPPTVKPVKA